MLFMLLLVYEVRNCYILFSMLEVINNVRIDILLCCDAQGISNFVL